MSFTTRIVAAAVLTANVALAQQSPFNESVPFEPQPVQRATASTLGSTGPSSSPSGWAGVVDSLWGEGEPTEQKLAAFDIVRGVLETHFACFHNVDVNWDSLAVAYRAEVERGTSQGRFAAIMNHLALALREPHTNVWDSTVNIRTPLAAGVPLLAVGAWGEVGHFGAEMTPLPDGSLLVMTAAASHPLDLAPGDIVLGYHGKRW